VCDFFGLTGRSGFIRDMEITRPNKNNQSGTPNAERGTRNVERGTRNTERGTLRELNADFVVK